VPQYQRQDALPDAAKTDEQNPPRKIDVNFMLHDLDQVERQWGGYVLS
jgi:hypothetical protein